MKTVRFSQLVEKSGRPEIHLAWSVPAKDPVLAAALKQHRVLTVHQILRGGQKDHGVVGADEGPDVQYLIFPKSLRSFEDRRVVGIQYDLLADALSLGPVQKTKKRPASSPSKQARPSADIPKTAAGPKPSVTAAEELREKPEKDRPTTAVAEFDSDPVKREIRLAIGDLASGHPRKAERRLRALLEN